jgi:hypothetical protein
MPLYARINAVGKEVAGGREHEKKKKSGIGPTGGKLR